MNFRAFTSLSLAIVRGFVRDKASVFFAILFPLMFLVLFGGIFSDQDQAPIDLIRVGDVAFIDRMPAGAEVAFGEAFEVTRSDDLGRALEQVRKGDADLALEQVR
jgi:ABC-2 type transport system permease protein